jgi:Rod binding domain-containing protein
MRQNEIIIRTLHFLYYFSQQVESIFYEYMIKTILRKTNKDKTSHPISHPKHVQPS